jgi:hypothetical protein
MTSIQIPKKKLLFEQIAQELGLYVSATDVKNMSPNTFTTSITVTPTHTTPTPHNKKATYYSDFTQTIDEAIESAYDDAIHTILNEGKITPIDHNHANFLKGQKEKESSLSWAWIFEDTCIGHIKRLKKIEDHRRTFISNFVKLSTDYGNILPITITSDTNNPTTSNTTTLTYIEILLQYLP